MSDSDEHLFRILDLELLVSLDPLGLDLVWFEHEAATQMDDGVRQVHIELDFVLIC